MVQSREFREYVDEVTSEFNSIPKKSRVKRVKQKEDRLKIPQQKKKPRYNYVCETCSEKFNTKLIFAKECPSCYYAGRTLSHDDISREFRDICKYPIT